MFEFVDHLFDTSDFPARWMCGRWTAGHGWLHILSDLGVWSAYVAIPCVLLFFFQRRKDLPFRKVFVLFGAFILLCGTTHLMEAIIFWWPAYRLAGVLKLLTAIVSWATVFTLIPIVPRVLALRSPEELEREIAARKQAEEALQRTNTELELRVEERTADLKRVLVEISNERELLSTTLQSIGDAVITTDTGGRITNMNAVAVSLTGWTTAEGIGQPLDAVFRIVNEKTRQPVLNPVFKALQEGVIVSLANHTLLIDKDGTERPIDDSAAPIRGVDRIIQGSVLVFRNVSERKRAEDALRESEQRLRFRSAILEQVNDVVGAIDTEQRILFLNAAGEQLYGVKASEMFGRPLIELYERRWPSPEYEAEALATLKEKGQARWEVVHVTRDGRELHVESKVAVFRDVDGKPQGLIAAVRDVTAQRKAAEDLRVSEEFSRFVLESSPDCVKVLDGEGRLQFMNTNGKCLMEIDDFTQFQGQHWWELWPAADRDRVRDAVERAKRGETVAFQAMRPNAKGVLKWWDVVVVPGSGRDAPGHAARLIAVSRDITERKQAEEALRKNAELFTRLVDQAPTGTYVVDAEFRMQQINALAAPVFGNVHPLIGRDFAEIMEHLWGPEVGGQIADIFRHTLATGEHYISPRFVEQRIDISEEQAYDWEAQRVTLADGRYGVVCYFQDITERQRAERALGESDARTRLATEATAVGIWEWNILTNTVRWDAQMFHIYGIEPTPDGFVYYSDWSGALLPEELLENEQILQDTVRRCGNSRREFRILRRSDGEQRDVESVETVRTNAQGQAEWVVGTNLDVTARKRLEEDLRVTAADLSEADRRKDEFMATLAHELRNPLAPIRNGLQVIKLAGVSGTVEQARSMMERQLTQMVRLVDDLLDVSRISQGKIELRTERVEMRAVIDAAVETSRPLIEEAGHDLVVAVPDEPIFVDGDATRLAQVVSNLLTNSAKYTHRSGNIRLNVRRDGEAVVVSVADDGIGIPPAMLDKVFVMFTQVDRTLEKTTGGLGIGLSLVKGLVEMHGGTIVARSEGEGKGSEFAVRLPVVIEASKPQESDIEEKEPVKSSLRILIVDDNRDSANSLAAILEIMGNDTRTAYDGQEGVDVAGKFRPDVVLFDIGLPKLNGYEACRRIREQPWGKDVVLIAATGWGQDEDRRRSQEAGFDHHLVKPVNLQVLEQMLRDIGHGTQV